MVPKAIDEMKYKKIGKGDLVGGKLAKVVFKWHCYEFGILTSYAKKSKNDLHLDKEDISISESDMGKMYGGLRGDITKYFQRYLANKTKENWSASADVCMVFSTVYCR